MRAHDTAHRTDGHKSSWSFRKPVGILCQYLHIRLADDIVCDIDETRTSISCRKYRHSVLQSANRADFSMYSFHIDMPFAPEKGI